LDSLGERKLGAALAACLDAADRVPSHDAGATVAALAHDDDEWIRVLSGRILAAGQVAAEGDVSVTEQVITGLDTMLILRRVSLFADLEPEDLQRIALVASERDFGAGAVLMREGEPGEDLFVITEGTVRVVQGGDDGTERYIRRYGPGEHIGELAVLRDRPRAATVIADETGVHGFSLDGESLRAILRERPDAAMAMLATLAERISTQ
ncbi:MAG: cyclic nucleotide-binding domain-containing protein, partial [Candidatus Limnocylindrales bacterium]